MSKSKIILLVIVAVLITVGIILGLEMQKRSITITTNTPVTLFSNTTKVAAVETTTDLKLKDGEYCAVAIDEAYSQDKKCFMVYKSNKTVALSVSYSKDRLASMLDKEYEAITARITAEYSSLLGSYTQCRGELFMDGSWYGGIIQDKVASLADTGNYYYFILKKEANWQLTVTPRVVISKLSPESKDVPLEVIQSVHTLQPCDPEVTSPENVPSNTVETFSVDKPVYTY